MNKTDQTYKKKSRTPKTKLNNMNSNPDQIL
jgi:hypothetical protein